MPRRSPGLSSRNRACDGAGTGSTIQGRGPSGSPPGTRGTYRLDTAAIRHLVDAATTADPHYTPSTTRREAQTRDTQARYARQIAKQEIAAGCHASTIRKNMTGRPGAVTRGG